MKRLPPDAFETYVDLGPDRSYRALAERYGVSKVAVVNKAKKERWQERLGELQVQARQESEKRAVESLKAVHERQLKAARFLQAKAIEVLQGQPAEKGIRAAGALNVAWKHELLLLGEPTERQASVEEITKREMARWLIADDDNEDNKARRPTE
jgi:hypothetical protein